MEKVEDESGDGKRCKKRNGTVIKQKPGQSAQTVADFAT